MTYTVTLPNGVKFTVCPPAIAEGAYTVERDQHLRQYGNGHGSLTVAVDATPPSRIEKNRIQRRMAYRRKRGTVKQYNRVS